MYVAPSEEEQDAPPADGIVVSDRVLGSYCTHGTSGSGDARTSEQRSAAQDLRAPAGAGLKWGEYYVPDDMLEQLTEEDASEGSGPDTEVEEAEAEEEAVYEDAMACLGMTITTPTSSTARASSPNSAIKSNIRGSREVHAAVPAASLDRLPETVLQQIFLYIVDQYWEASYQVIPLERVCKAMHWALRPEGKFWNLFAPWRVKSLGHVACGIQWCWPEDDCLVDDVLAAEARRKIVRRLAYRAGIVKLTSEVFDLVAAELLHSLGVLLVDAFEVSREAQLQRFGQDLNFIRHTTQYLTYGGPCDGHDMQSAGIDMFSTPPPPMPASEDPDRPYESGYAYTIVPGQIKNAALKRFSGQGGPYHVYGDTWVAGFGFTCEEEKEKEESYYFSENIEDPSPSLLQRVEAERDELARRLAIYEYDSDYESESDGSSESDEDDYSAGAMSIGY